MIETLLFAIPIALFFILKFIIGTVDLIAGMPLVVYFFIRFVYEKKREDPTRQFGSYMYLIIGLILLVSLLVLQKGVYCSQNHYQSMGCIANMGKL